MNSTGMDQRAQSSRFWLVVALHFSGAVGQVAHHLETLKGKGAGHHGLLSIEQAQIKTVAIGDPFMHVRRNQGGALGSDVTQAAGQFHVADVVGGGGRAHFAGGAIQDLNRRRARGKVNVAAREVASRVAQRVEEAEGTRDRPQGLVDEAFS